MESTHANQHCKEYLHPMLSVDFLRHLLMLRKIVVRTSLEAIYSSLDMGSLLIGIKNPLFEQTL